MDLITMLTSVTHPGVEVDTPDPCDPASAAAFASLLAGLATPPMGPVPVEAAAVEVAAVEVEVQIGRGDQAAARIEPTAMLARPIPAPAHEVGGRSGPQAPPSAPNPGLRADEGAHRLHLPPTPEDAPPTPAPPTPLETTDPVAPRLVLAAPLPSRAPIDAPTAPTPAPAETAPIATAPVTPVTTTEDAPDAEPEPTPAPGAVHEAHRPAAPTPAEPAPVDAVATSAPLERVLATQLVSRIGRLRHVDGEHELTLQLEPADLGRLELRVRLEAGVVHVHVTADGQDTSDLLRRSLPDLRQLLADAGLSAGSLDVGQHRGRQAPTDRSPAPAALAHRAAPAAATSFVRSVDPTRGVDVLL